jgi:hypothetical protein
MKVKIGDIEYACDSAKRMRTAIFLTKNNGDGTKATSTYSGCNIVETAEVIDGVWEYDAFAEPSQADRIEAQVAYTAMMTDTLLEV